MAKIALNIISVILILLAFVDLLFWRLAGASSHNVPARTTNSIIISLVVLVCLITIVRYLKSKLKAK